jgi:hypothetical protein
MRVPSPERVLSDNANSTAMAYSNVTQWCAVHVCCAHQQPPHCGTCLSNSMHETLTVLHAAGMGGIDGGLGVGCGCGLQLQTQQSAIHTCSMLLVCNITLSPRTFSPRTCLPTLMHETPSVLDAGH